jgi:hypothetical protein
MKPSPGPWSWDTDSDAPCTGYVCDRDGLIVFFAEVGEDSTSCDRFGDNLRLASTAPEMVYALRRALTSLELLIDQYQYVHRWDEHAIAANTTAEWLSATIYRATRQDHKP